MDRSYRTAVLSTQVRRAWEALSRVTMALEDLQARDLALKSFEAELHLLDLHRQLLEAATDPTTHEQSSRSCAESQLPF